MSGKMERIPIISLSGCKSLTDFFAELPIAQPSHLSVSCRTLLYEPKLVHDAYRCINTEDPVLIQRLCTALNGVSVDNINFKDVSSEPSQEVSKSSSPPTLLTILEKSGAFLPSAKLSETQIDVKDLTRHLSCASNLTNLSVCPELQASNDSQQTRSTLPEEPPPDTNIESTSESYSAVHIAPLKISLKKCPNIEDVLGKKGKKSRRKPDSSPKVRITSQDQAAESRNLPNVDEDAAHSDPSSVQIPVLKISTAAVRIIPVSSSVSDETARNTSSESLPQSLRTSQPSVSPQRLSVDTPPPGVTVDENSRAVASPKCSTNDFSESIPGPSTSSSPKHATSSLVPSVSILHSTAASTTSTATIVTSINANPNVGSTSTVSVSTTTAPVTVSSVTASPASSASHSVNHDSASSRRVPDPALSQMFHSAALFHTYQAHGEPEKLGSCAGGGLFDDWLDASVKTTDPSFMGPVNDGIYSGSLSGPSSVVNVPSNCSQAPHSVGASGDVSVCAPRTPLSVPSNHSSYPATPGGGLTTVALSVNTAVNTIAASPSALSKSIYPPTGLNSPSVRLFDTSEARSESHEPAVEEQTRIAPQGLAAYLPRSASLRPTLPAAVDDSSVGLLPEEGRTTSPGTAVSPDGTGIRSWGSVENGGKPSSTNKQSKCSTYANTSPVKSGGRGRFSAGKPRGGGRRRRTELEELTSWSVNDRAPVPGDKKSELTSDLLDVQSADPKEVISISAPRAPETTLHDTSKTTEHANNKLDTIEGSSHGAFTEALVERVKRRRQQREIELNKRRSGQCDLNTCRSSDISPASTPSPVRSMGRGGDSVPKATKTSELKGQHKMTNRFTVDQRMNNGSLDAIRSLHNPSERSRPKQLRHKSSDSDTSLSPPSTTASSMRSSKPSSVSSCIDSVPPPPPDHMYVHLAYTGATKSSMPSYNPMNLTCESSETLSHTVIHSKHHDSSQSSTSHPPTALLDRNRLHDRSSTESHFSPPSRTLFQENPLHPRPPTPTTRIQGPPEAFIDDDNRYTDLRHRNHNLASPVHTPLANKPDMSQLKRRRRVIISDDEETEASPLRMDSPTLSCHSRPPPRLDEFEPQDSRTASGSRLLGCSAAPLPPILQPLNGIPPVQATSVKHMASTLIMKSSGSASHMTHGSRDNKELMKANASSRISTERESDSTARSNTDTVDDIRMSNLNEFERTSLSTTSGSTNAGDMCHPHTNHELSAGKHGMHASRPQGQNPETEGRISSDDDGFTKAIRACQRSPSNESMGSLASSSQLASTYGGGFLPEPGCRTPSTIAYTHSSAMGDSDSRDSDLESLPKTSGQRPEADSGIATPNASPVSAQEAPDSDVSDESLPLNKGSDCSSPSSLSAQSDDNDQGSADDSDEARHQSEQLTEAAAALAQFTERLSKILRRVEELDLLRLATKVNENRHARGSYSAHSGADGEPDASSFDEHLIPDAARLTRHELSVLYSESAQVRLSGSMFTIPTGRLVRFLTLLLVNMQAGAHTTPAPLTQAEVDHFLRKRQKAESQHRDGSRRSQSNQLTESILWANPLWASVLTALDCARIALNIIVAPDMPRPLLMEDLIDGIVSVVRSQLEGVVCKTYNNGRSVNHQLGFSDQKLWNFACECVGFRTSQLMATLSSLIRFQPNRFTDNLVIRLTELGLTVPLYCLTSGQSMERDPKRLTVPAMRKLLILHTSSSSRVDHRTSMPPFPVGPSRLWLLVWPDRLQRASLALLAGLYGQYEAHRKLIVDEIFRTLLSQPVTSSSVNPPASGDEIPITVNSSPDKRAMRTFRLLSSHWLYKQSQRLKHSHRILPSVTDPNDPANSSVPIPDDNRSSQFVYVHALTALFLSLSQGLIQSPGSGTGSSTSSGPNGVSRKSISTPGSGEQNGLDNSQFLKDEKQVLASYNICVRHAHYLLSGLLKRVCARTELDLRPVLDTVTCDLLNVATAAPVEWPVASTLLCVLGGLLIQHLNQNSSSTSSRATDLSSKLVYLDTLSTLALGLRRSAVLSLEHRSSLRRPEVVGGRTQKSRLTDRLSSNEADDFTTTETNLKRRELMARTQLIAFISSPVPMLNTWLLQPGLGDSPDGEAVLGSGRYKERDCVKQIRLEYTDYLFVTAQRFLLASWLHSCTRDLGEAIAHANNRRSSVETTSASSSKSASKRVRELEQLRHQLLSELALTHHLPSSSLPLLAGSKHSGSALVGSSSLSSPSSNKPARQTSASHAIGSGIRNSSGSTPCRILIHGGSFLSHESSAKRFVEYAHSKHMDRRLRLRLAAHAHWSAWQLMSLHPIVPGFEKLFSSICRLVGESSVPVRTKALRCLSAVIEIDPKLFICNSASEDAEKQVGQTAWLRDLPRLVHARLLDNSAAVREAAVDLVSKLLVLRPQALSEYYPMLAERVLDKGVSVRKRAIRCFRDLLVVDWDGSGSGALGGGGVRPRGKQKFILMTNQLGVEMCIKLIRRLHDEDSIQKLVIEVFHNLWFTPIPETNVHCSKLLDRRILSLSAVTLTLRSSNFEVLESFLKQILTTNDSTKFEQLDTACVQLVSRLLVLIKRLSASFLSGQKRYSERPKSAQTSDSNLPMPSLQGLLASLHLLSRCKPELLRAHAEYLINLLHKAPLATLTPSSTVVPSSTNSPAVCQPVTDALLGLDAQCLYHLISVIEMTLLSLSSASRESVCDHISNHRLNDLQLDLIRLIQRQGRLVVDSALSCLATLTNGVLKDHTQVVVCFAQFYGLLANLSSDLRRSMSSARITSPPTHISSRTRPSVLRALYTVGLMCKNFAFDNLLTEDKLMSTNTDSFLNEVVDTLILFAEYASTQVSSSTPELKPAVLQMNDADLCRKAIMGLGFVVSRHDKLLCDKRVRTFYSHFFTSTASSSSPVNPLGGGGGMAKPSPFHEVQCIILDNLTHYLMDNERQMVADARSWSVRHKLESLKELADQRSGHGSAVAQEYLPLVLKHCILTQAPNVRASALGLLSVILRQGLVHPVQTLPYLICLQTDADAGNRSRATHLLVEAERKVPGFIAMRAASGIQLSYQLQVLLCPSSTSCSNRDSTAISAVPLVRGAVLDSLNCATPDAVIPVPTNGSCPIALNHAVYSLIRSNRQNRRSLISNLLSLFDLDQSQQIEADDPIFPHTSSKPSLGQLIFVADQLAHFPYTVLDEVFFIAYHVEQRLSYSGSSLVQLVQQALLSSLIKPESDTHRSKKDGVVEKSQAETQLLNLIESAENKVLASGNQRKMEKLSGKLGTDWDQGEKIHLLFKQAQPAQLRDRARQGMVSSGPICWLLLTLRHHLRDYYGVTDSKLKDYSPSDSPKQWERPIVFPKRAPNNNSHILRLPTLVIECLNNPTWSHPDSGPPDTVVLYQFIRLRQQLLALEDSSHMTGFLSPNPVSQLTTTVASTPDGSVVKCPTDVEPKCGPNVHNTHSANESSTEFEVDPKNPSTNIPPESRSDKPESSLELGACKPANHASSETKRGRANPATVQTAARSSQKSVVQSVSTASQKYIEKSLVRKRRPQSSSISSLSSSESDSSASSRRHERPRISDSNDAFHSKTLHTPAKLSRVSEKSAHLSSSNLPARDASPVTSGRQPPPHKISKRPLAPEATNVRSFEKDVLKRPLKPSSPSSSSDLESSSSGGGSNNETEPARGRHAFTKLTRKKSGDQGSSLHNAHKISAKLVDRTTYHNDKLNTGSFRAEPNDRRPKDAPASKRENPMKSESEGTKAAVDRKTDSSSSLTKSSLQSNLPIAKSADKTALVKAPRPSGTGSSRSLAPLPQAMMQGMHGHTHRSTVQSQNKHNRKHIATHTSGSSSSTKRPPELRSGNGPILDRPAKPTQSKSNSSSNLAAAVAKTHVKAPSKQAQHDRTAKETTKPKSRVVRRLSDSSSLSSESDGGGKEDRSKTQCNSNRNSNVNQNKSGKHHNNTTSSTAAGSSGLLRRNMHQRSSSSVSSVSSSSSSSDVSSSSSSTTSMSSSPSTASSSPSPTSDSSNLASATKPNKQRKILAR